MNENHDAAKTSESPRNRDDFMRRLQILAQRLDKPGINYRHASVETPEPNPLE
jgi:hypothetical protein